MCICVHSELEEWYTNFTHSDTLLSKESLFPENECQAYEHKCLWIPISYKKLEQLVLRQFILRFYVH